MSTITPLRPTRAPTPLVAPASGPAPAQTVQLTGIVKGDAKLQALVAQPQQLSLRGRPTAIDYRPAVAALMPSVFDPATAPGATATEYTWAMWGHSVIPADERPGVMFAIIAEGSAYKGPNTQLRYQNGGRVEIAGRIVKIGIARDYPTKDFGYNGDETEASFTVHGQPGEVVKLRYMRLSVDAQGNIVGGGTPDDAIAGASGAYLGRQMAVKIGMPQRICSPEDSDRDYRAMIRYYFGYGQPSGPTPDLSRLAIDTASRQGS